MYTMKKIVLLALAALVLTGCTVKEKETEITVFNNTVSAVYTGKVKRKVPEGEGSAYMDNDVSVEGLFENGTLVSGEASNVPYNITYNTQTISGTYTGEVAGQLPSGSGDFTSDMFSYSGTWIDGEPGGKGTVSAENFRMDTLSEVLEGSYSGEINQGLAEGHGTFTYTDGNHEIEMSGNFAGNKFDGLMVKTIRYPDTVKSFPVYYQKGWPLHTAVAMIAYLEGMRNESYCLSEAQSSFISEHSALFEGKDTKLPEDYDHTFDYEAFSEEDEPSLVLIRNAVIRSVQRYKPYADSDTVTSMIVQNHDGWYHLVFPYAVDQADPDETADFYILPLCRSTLTAPEQDYPAIDAVGAMMTGN